MKLLLIVSLVAVVFCPLARADDSKAVTTRTAIDADVAEKFITTGKQRLRAPPQKPGCYNHTGEWREVPCLSREEISRLPLPFGVYLDQTSLPSAQYPIEYAKLKVDIVRLGSEIDSNLGTNSFSLQLNSNEFHGNNGDTDWIQFVYQKSAMFDILCVWQIDLTTSNYTQYTQCVNVKSTRSIKTGDAATLSGALYGDNVGVTAILPWGADAVGAPDAFSVSAPNAYGLGNLNPIWNTIDGGLLGTGSRSEANLTQSCVTTTLQFLYFTLLDPSVLVPPIVRGVDVGGETLESNNLKNVNTPIAQCEPSVQAYGTCSASFEGVSKGWSNGRCTCYPQEVSVQRLPPSTPQGTFQDDGTQLNVNGTNVHICPGGALLIGVDGTHNRFLCSNAFLVAVPTGEESKFADTSTHVNYTYGNQEHRVHVCPKDSVMIGWDKDKNWLICRPMPPSGFVTIHGFGDTKVDGPGGTQVTEPKNSGQKMHACDSQGTALPLAMSGIEATDDVLICMNSLVTPRIQ